MDIETTLTMIRGHVEDLLEDNLDETQAADAALDLADLFAAMDQWLSRGGFLPKAWERTNNQ